MNTDYYRVMPRDLFNEANLLKCLGKLSLWHADGFLGLIRLTLHQPGQGFQIQQNQEDGSLQCVNLQAFYKDGEIALTRPLNSRQTWPLMFEYPMYQDADPKPVFTDTGDLSDEFRAAFNL